ncbi:hypothetical protein [Chitinibacter sp. S2-10]|uniref:hypothetical protein n=1 Tax=Chitinibacter sp. S2-10 TaxID=3373597 RepID=UPI0039775229
MEKTLVGIATIIPSLVYFLTNWVISTNLSHEEYAHYGFIYQVTNSFLLIFDLGLTTLFLLRTDEHGDIHKTAISYFSLKLWLGMVLLLFALPIFFFFSVNMALYISIAYLTSGLCLFITAYYRTGGFLLGYVVIRIVPQIAFLCVALIFFKGVNAEVVFFSYSLIYFFLAITVGWRLLDFGMFCSRSGWKWSWKILCESFRICISSFFIAIASGFVVEAYFVKLLAPVQLQSTFFLFVQFLMVFNLAQSVLSNYFMPKSISLKGGMKKEYLVFIFTLLLPLIVIFLFSPYWIDWFFPRYSLVLYFIVFLVPVWLVDCFIHYTRIVLYKLNPNAISISYAASIVGGMVFFGVNWYVNDGLTLVFLLSGMAFAKLVAISCLIFFYMKIGRNVENT